MVLSGSLDYFFTNDDYLNVIKQVEKYLGVKFNIACCLDVGLAAGFTLNENGKLVKLLEPGFHDETGNLDFATSHTATIALVQQ